MTVVAGRLDGQQSIIDSLAIVVQRVFEVQEIVHADQALEVDEVVDDVAEGQEVPTFDVVLHNSQRIHKQARQRHVH